MIENKKYITCKICNKKLERINNFHLKKHNINSESEYLKIYPNADTCSKTYIKRV